MMRMLDGGVEGFFVMGQNPAVGSQHAGLQRRALAKLKWLVVRDLAEIETATFWRDSPEVQSGELRTEDIETEVFLMPAAAHVEKEGCFTNTQRLVQFRDKALEPPGDARSELWFMHHLAKRVQGALRATRREQRDWPIVNLRWDYPELGRHPRARRRGGAEGDQRLRRRDRAAAVRVHRAARRRLDRLRLLDLLGHLRRRRQPGPAARARRPDAPRAATSRPSGGGRGRRTAASLYNRASADPDGTPVVASARSTSGGTRREGRWTGYDVPDFPADKPPDYRAADGRARAWTRSAATTRS